MDPRSPRVLQISRAIQHRLTLRRRVVEHCLVEIQDDGRRQIFVAGFLFERRGPRFLALRLFEEDLSVVVGRRCERPELTGGLHPKDTIQVLVRVAKRNRRGRSAACIGRGSTGRAFRTGTTPGKCKDAQDEGCDPPILRFHSHDSNVEGTWAVRRFSTRSFARCESRASAKTTGCRPMKVFSGCANTNSTNARPRQTRREWVTAVAQAGAAAAATSVLSPAQRLFAGAPVASIDVGVVGAGIAGLACADTLAASGIRATVYEAGTRVGGRCISLRDMFPGQVAERGGEFIDTPHKTMLRYAKRFNLALEDVSKEPGDVFYHLGGKLIPESTVVDEFRDFVAVMRVDLRRLSNEPTALNHTDADVTLDRTSLSAYLDGANGARRAAGSIANAAIRAAYIAEFGLEPEQQSCLNFLGLHPRRPALEIHAVRGLQRRAVPRPRRQRSHRLGIGAGAATPRRARHETRGRPRNRRRPYRADIRHPAGVVSRTHDAVVLAIPFTTLRAVDLDIDLDRVPGKRAAIDHLGYGTNAKMMVGFDGRPWIDQGGNGTAYAGSRETRLRVGDKSRARDIRSRRVDRLLRRRPRCGPGPRGGAARSPLNFLRISNLVFPGARAAARRVMGTWSRISSTGHQTRWR